MMKALNSHRVLLIALTVSIAVLAPLANVRSMPVKAPSPGGSISVNNTQSNQAATGIVLDDTRWPTAKVAIKNDHTFWLHWSIFNNSSLLNVTRDEAWARLGYIPPDAQAELTIAFDPRRDSSIQFFVDAGRTNDGSMSAAELTVLQRIIDTILTAVGGAKRFQSADAQAILDAVSQFNQLPDCADAVQIGLSTDAGRLGQALEIGPKLWNCLTDEKQLAVLASIASRYGVQVSTETLKNVVFTPLAVINLTREVVDTMSAIVFGSWAGSIVFESRIALHVPNGTPSVAPSVASEANVWMFGGNPGRTGVNPGPGPLDQPSMLWRFKAGDQVTTSPAIVDGVAYVGSYDSHLYAVDINTGKEIWSFVAGGWMWSSPAVADGVVYAGSVDFNLYAIDAKTGTELWRYSTGFGGSVRSAPAVVDGVVYDGDDAGYVYALDARTGAELWKYRDAAVSASQRIVSTPAVGDGMVFATAYDNAGNPSYLYALDATTGSELWRMAMHSFVTSPVVVGDAVYVGDQYPGTVYAVNARTGAELWHASANQPNSIVAANGAVYVGDSGGALQAFDAQSGKVLWRFTAGDQVFAMAIAEGAIYAASWDGNLYAVDAATGLERWHVRVTGVMYAAPVISNGVIFVGSSDGSFVAFADSGAKRAEQSLSEADIVQRARQAVKQAQSYRFTEVDDDSGRTGEGDVYDGVKYIWPDGLTQYFANDIIVNWSPGDGWKYAGALTGFWGQPPGMLVRETSLNWTLKGTDEIDGQPVYVLTTTVPGAAFDSVTLWIDATTFLPRKSKEMAASGAAESYTYTDWGAPVSVKVPQDALTALGLPAQDATPAGPGGQMPAPTAAATQQVSIGDEQGPIIVNVEGYQPWTDSGVNVVAGDQITVSASGIVYIAGSDPGKPPAGDPPSVPCAGAAVLAPQQPCSSLIGRIDNGVPFGIGAEASISAPASGRLYLGVNDSEFGDNSGAWTVTIDVTSSSPSSSQSMPSATSQAQRSLSVDLGNPVSEANVTLQGWGAAQGAPENPLTAPSGDRTKRFQTLDSDNLIIFSGTVPGTAYVLTSEVEDGGCADDFAIVVAGTVVYQYEAVNGPNQVVSHQVTIPGNLVTGNSLTVIFRNTSTDGCGLAAVYNVQLMPQGTANSG